MSVLLDTSCISDNPNIAQNLFFELVEPTLTNGFEYTSITGQAVVKH